MNMPRTPAPTVRKTNRRRSREFAMQGLYQWQLAGTDAATIESQTYDAWGNVISSSGSTVTPYRFIGRQGYQTDTATGQVYVRARMYQPTTARWSSPKLEAYLESRSGYSEMFPSREFAGQASEINQDPKDRPDFPPIVVKSVPDPGDFFQDGSEKCKCKSVWGNRIRPTSPSTGKSPPEKGLPYCECKVGETVIVKYETTCEGEPDWPCWGPCEGSTCYEYTCYRCRSRTNMTPGSKYPDIKTQWVNCIPNPLPKNRGGQKTKCQSGS